MDPVKKILGKSSSELKPSKGAKKLCPKCGSAMTDVGYWWCKSCGFEGSYRELEYGLR